MSEAPLLPFPQGCVVGNFIRRVKRFSVEMTMDIAHGQERIWIHSNNSGSMMGLLRQDAPVLASPAANPARKLRWTQELVGLYGMWVGVNTRVPNTMLEAAFYASMLPWAQGYTQFMREAVCGESRLDARLDGPEDSGLPTLWVECKNVTLVEDEVAAFPDAATVRGQKHLREMMEIVARGGRAAMFYLVQRADGHCFAPADYIDPVYADLFYSALAAGVEVYPYRALISEQGIDLGPLLPVRADARMA